MDYKKKYKEAIERARQIHDADRVSGIELTTCEKIFPKLAESEDEKIRKALIFYLGNMPEDTELRNGVTNRDVLAWLGKQRIEKLTVKPKFKVGDWIIYSNEEVQLITGFDDNGYFVDKECYIPFNCEGNMRLWTIADAKDGNVLYHKAENGIEYIVMSKGLNENNNIDSYFRYNSINGFGIDIPSVLSAKCDSITPATKEQRDLLFQKMNEAGYKWDAEKKELKKIEQKPAWNEEDKKFMCDILSNLIDLKNRYGKGYGNVGKCIDWLKSLKERYTWKPSDDQIDALGKILEYFKRWNAYGKTIDECKSLYEQLKKLTE